MAISFQNVTNDSGISYIGKSWGAAWSDFNGDSYPDLWVNNHQDTGIFYLNQGNGTFTDTTDTIFPVPESGDTHTSAWADFDRDGDLDLVQVTDGGNGIQLYVNEEGVLTNRANDLILNNSSDLSSFLARGVLWFDYDKDGLLDIVVNAAPNKNAETASTIFRQTEFGFEYIGIDTVFDAPSVGTAPFGIVSDLTGDGNVELILKDLDTPFIVYDTTSIPFQDVTNTLLPTLPSGNQDDNIDSDLIAADFNGDLLVDLYLTQKPRGQSDLGQVDRNLGKAKFFIYNEEEGIEFKTNGDVTFNFLGRGGVRSGAFQPVSLNNIYIGSDGINPTDNEFTLSPRDPNAQGLLAHTPGTDSGIYVGYDSAAQQWQLFFSSPAGGEQGIIFESTEEITELAALGFDPEQSNLPDRLFINNEQGFIERSEESGLDNPISGVNAVAGDFDNDMDSDIYVVETGSAANRDNILYDNQGDGTFVSISNVGGAAGSSLGLGDSVTTVDYDLDGFLDLFVTNGSWPPIGLTEVNPGGESLDGDTFGDGLYELFRNEGNSNNWLQIDLQGVSSNIEGIGAQIFATAGGVTQLREQGGGFHSKSQNHQRIHFGLAENTQVDLLEIRWPSGAVQQWENIAANQIISITEETSTLSGVINGTEEKDTIDATDEDEQIDGLGDRDVLRGKGGNDTLNGNEGNDNLLGGFNDDVLNGNSGNDFLVGGYGNDTLTGGANSDRFRIFRTDDGIDEVTDFTPGEDSYEIEGNNFGGGLVKGVLPSSQFVSGTTANSSGDRFIYDLSRGNLFFDVDGVGGNEQVLLATLSNQANLSASDIVIF